MCATAHCCVTVVFAVQLTFRVAGLATLAGYAADVMGIGPGGKLGALKEFSPWLMLLFAFGNRYSAA